MKNPVHMDQVRILAHFSYDGAKDRLVMDNSSSLSSDKHYAQLDAKYLIYTQIIILEIK